MKKNLRKVFAVMAAVVMTAGVAACSSSAEESSSGDSGDKTKIGIVQMADNGAFTDMREGFIAQMNAKGYDDSNTEFILSLIHISSRYTMADLRHRLRCLWTDFSTVQAAALRLNRLRLLQAAEEAVLHRPWTE